MKKNFATSGFVIWVLTGALIFPISFFVSMAMIKLLGLGAQEDKLAGFFIVPLTIGAVLLCNWVILKNYLRDIYRWLVFTFLGFVLLVTGAYLISALIIIANWAILDPKLILVYQLVFFTIAALVLGGFQVLALRGYKKALLMLPANVIGLLLIRLAIGESITNTFEMALIGGILALTTGIALTFILSSSKN